MANLGTSAADRIAFTYAAAFAAAILLLGIAVYFAADAEFRRQRDVAIAAELHDLAHEGSRAEMIREITQREAGRTAQSFLYTLFDRDGRYAAGARVTPRPAIGFGEVTFNDPIEGPDPMRAKAADVADGERLVVSADSETIETIDRTILELFGAACGAIVLVGALSGILLGRYLRRRLGTISATAAAVVAGDFGQRMPIGARGDEFDTVALALNAMLDRIAALMESLRQVSSDVAHDLRTPLLRLRNQLERVGTTPGAAQRAIELGDEVLKLFGSILRIAEVESGGLARAFGEVDLSALVEDVADGYLPALTDDGRSLVWTVAPNIHVHGDRELLAQALANLLDNTLVHTPVGVHVDLMLSADETTARVSVSDDGPGVAAAEHTHILGRFYRAEASRTTPGNGLGLSLAAAVASAHGGTLVAESAGPGLRVTIALPRVA